MADLDVALERAARDIAVLCVGKFCDPEAINMGEEVRLFADELLVAEEPLAVLAETYEARLATVTRERDEALASLAAINTDLQRAAQALARVVAPHVATMLACGECHTPVSADGAEVSR
ncbi:MAG: hypothetical protein EKK55_20200 [Rhodocyclaceae bacterium]|nr:MAG: hypothetical protein EKK55_20200 [Rhodocyclaceae bacterium]